MDLSLLSQLNAGRAARRAAILVTNMTDGSQRLIKQNVAYRNDLLAEEFDKRFLSGKSGLVKTDAGEAFLTVSVPAPRLVLIGAVHISQALVPMAEIAGFNVSVIDPRTAFATEDRFPGSSLLAEWPEDVLRDQPFDPYTAVAAVTHDPKIDDYPLMEALKTGCFYVGALGSKKTHGKRLERFREAGLSVDVMSRIEAPIGLDIGAASPQEIAVAVLASVIKALRKPGGVPA
ncbi:XdhC family protein [Roseibium alexandrii]|uniref:Xanthine and CO dehydrogenase maturation factor, XdhC/CoxF family n=1 Tax=Roseibium alexandrii (strain DSM 17067 / NCIMB 14079 / DFL-11) TaxID=244592 RepID=A0A5E8GYU3_ROSAD|nr:XdhC family protein [Roseibium alexandrii]EEE44746.1 Xanthine and CO dehydrogenase maturation factor, XdhC/CoxF family [Roseibium alexandrii DFL-11]